MVGCFNAEIVSAPRREAGQRSSPAPPQLRPGGRKCHLWGDACFEPLRRACVVPDDFLNDWRMEDLRKSHDEAGSYMSYIGCEYIVKELSHREHLALLASTESYVEHVKDGNTLLALIFLHFQDAATGRKFIAMRNQVGSGPLLASYDLKGCRQDKTVERNGVYVKPVRKRVWDLPMWIPWNWSQDRRTYFSGKQVARKLELALPEKQRIQVLDLIRRDTAWLQRHRFTDYSLLVSIKAGPPGFAGPSGLAAGRPGIVVQHFAEGKDLAIYFSIIDYLEPWTLVKKLSWGMNIFQPQTILPPAAFAKRFCRHFEERFNSAPLSAQLLAKAQIKVKSSLLAESPSTHTPSDVGEEEGLLAL